MMSEKIPDKILNFIFLVTKADGSGIPFKKKPAWYYMAIVLFLNGDLLTLSYKLDSVPLPKFGLGF